MAPSLESPASPPAPAQRSNSVQSPSRVLGVTATEIEVVQKSLGRGQHRLCFGERQDRRVSTAHAAGITAP